MSMGRLELSTPSALEIAITRRFRAPRQLVFDAHTQPDLLRRWMLGPPGWTLPVCEIDLRVGGRYRFVWRQAGGQEMGMGGEFLEIVAPALLVNTQLFDEDWTGGQTIGRLDLTEADGITTLVNTIRYASPEAREAALATGMTEGMELGYQDLEALIAEVA